MDVMSILSGFPRYKFSLLPTPFHKLENISRDLSCNIYCKRDDLTGFAFGGNKTRKLDFLIADVLSKNFNAIIAVGAIQSNFCRIAAAAAKNVGLDVYLVLGGTKPQKPTANYLLAQIFGAKIHQIASEDWNEWEKISRQLGDELESQGKHAYILPVGGSTPIGALGYVNAFFEILNDCKKMNIELDSIIHASSSGGTQAGLIVGKALSGWEGKIIGMGVAKSNQQLKNEIYNLAVETGKLFGINIKEKDVSVDNSYMGKGYGKRTEEAEYAIDYFAKKEGILLDHVYTGKAAAGLLDYVNKGLITKSEKVLFIHTGGNIELFE